MFLPSGDFFHKLKELKIEGNKSPHNAHCPAHLVGLSRREDHT
jgi:hypothetical protein